jgi:hypothetical protein
MEKLNFEKMEVVNGGDLPWGGSSASPRTCLLAGLSFIIMPILGPWSVPTLQNCWNS